DPNVLLQARLAPDMFHFTKQVQVVTDQAKNGASRLAQVEPPKYEDNETSLAALKDRVSKTLAHIQSLDAGKIDASPEREISFPMGPGKTGNMKGADYLNHFVLPNFFFHLSMAYANLRHLGVEVGKRDFLGAIPVRMS